MTSGKCKKCHEYFFDVKNLISIIENKKCTGCYIKPDKYFEIKCEECNRNLNDPSLKKIRRKNICLDCHIKNEKAYELKLYDTYGNPCGGTSIYRVLSKKNNLRLHNIAHYEIVLPGIRDMDGFYPIYNWKNVWDIADGWCNPKWIQKFKGKIKKGICHQFCQGNGIIAFVLDSDNNYYYIHGVWG